MSNFGSFIYRRLSFQYGHRICNRGIASSYFYENGKRPSYYHRVGSEQLLAVPFNRVIDATVDRFPDRIAVVDRAQNIKKTFTQLYCDIESMAKGLLSLNCHKGDRISIWSPSRYEWLVSQMAAVKTGLILVPLNAAFQPPEVDYCLTKMGIKTLVISDKFKTQDYYKMMTSLVPEIESSKPGQSVKSKKYPNLENVIVMSEQSLPGAFTFKDVMQLGGKDEKLKLDDLTKKIQFDDTLLVLMTSGTTGRPKGATLSHIGIINCVNVLAKHMGFNKEPHTLCCFVPLFHGYGTMGGAMMMMLHGVNLVIPCHDYDPAIHLKAIEENKCTAVYGTPTMLLDLVSHPEIKNTDVSTITSIMNGGAPITPELVQQIHKTFPNITNATVGYGLSEVSGMTSLYLSQVNDGLIETSGKVIDHIEVKVVDSDDVVVPFGTPGEICSRGYHLMKGYWEDEEKTKEATKDGWLHTGDIGSLSEDGYITVLSRKSDMIIRGGTNIYPKEIEDVLVTHPKIADAHVIGVPDERLGEVVCAWVKVAANETMTDAELVEFCRGKISHFKIPKLVRFVKEFPRTNTGKVYKLKMREEEVKSIQK